MAYPHDPVEISSADPGVESRDDRWMDWMERAMQFCPLNLYDETRKLGEIAFGEMLGRIHELESELAAAKLARHHDMDKITSQRQRLRELEAIVADHASHYKAPYARWAKSLRRSHEAWRILYDALTKLGEIDETSDWSLRDVGSYARDAVERSYARTRQR